MMKRSLGWTRLLALTAATATATATATTSPATTSLTATNQSTNRYWDAPKQLSLPLFCRAECDFDRLCGVEYESGHTMMNWSSTHASTPQRIYHPKSPQEVVRVLQSFHQQAEQLQTQQLSSKSIKIRPVGTALSPNGIGLAASSIRTDGGQLDNMNCALSLSHLDDIRVDTRRQEVTVGAGAKVSTVLSELGKHGLTLSNFSSIQEQQIGGWTQVSAHGTGCKLSTVDEMIVRMQLATPTEGLITLSSAANNHLFQFAKVGLGCLGVVTELTLKCMPQISLRETTTIFNRGNVEKDHLHRLRNFRHVRYMWVPYTDTVVSVVSNPTSTEDVTPSSSASRPSPVTDVATQPLSQLVWDLKLLPGVSRTVINSLSFSQLRDILLDHSPLDVEHIKRVNKAEAEFWQASTGDRVGDSTDILGFDCGGEQHVLEVCFPMGRLSENSSKDLEFVRRLLQLLEDAKIPAPSPVEQRWCAHSPSRMSPAFAHVENGDVDPPVFSWVGIIMYLPPNQDDRARLTITRRFDDYVALIEPLLQEFDAHVHWAKIELPGREEVIGNGKTDDSSRRIERLDRMKQRLAQKYPLAEFSALRAALDPFNILGNDLVDTLLLPQMKSN
jgi:L-galactono-1,4-lactone dehydrogenase